MDLILSVIRYRGMPQPQAPSSTIGVAGGTIGRSPGNDLVLPDPDRWVSGQHVRIQFRDGAFFLRDTSTNGTVINHGAEPLRQGQETMLRDGDELTIGAYDVSVSIAEGAAPHDEPFDPFSRVMAGSEPDQALATDEDHRDILDLVAPASEIHEPLSSLEAQEDERPVTHDWFGADSPEAEARAPLLGSKRSESVDSPPAEPDHTPDENAYFRPPAAIPEDYDLWTDESSIDAGAEAIETGAPETNPSEAGSSGQPMRRPYPSKPLRDVVAKHTSPAGEIDALKAFLSGLGSGDLPAEQAERVQLMRSAGMLLRVMTEGLMRVMMTRASFKRELRLEMTTIRPVENNPFKFSVDPEDALNHILFRPGRGFLPAKDAAREAFDDIQRHEMAMIAGMRAALQTLLARLDPKNLEQRFQDRSVLDSLMPLGRKAKYWELFTEEYGEIAGSATEDFPKVFGAAFNRAYEDQTQRLKDTSLSGHPHDER